MKNKRKTEKREERRGENTHTYITIDITALTLNANSPEKSYIPQECINVSVCLTDSGLTTC